MGPKKINNVSSRGLRAKLGEMTTHPRWMRGLGDYALALLLVAIGATVRWTLTRLVGPGLPPYITFHPVVMVVALSAGVRPGLLAALATVLLADYWLLAPQGQFGIEHTVDAGRFQPVHGSGQIHRAFLAGRRNTPERIIGFR
jgi:K+-sensing histidine kinase KdpD